MVLAATAPRLLVVILLAVAGVSSGCTPADPPPAPDAPVAARVPRAPGVTAMTVFLREDADLSAVDTAVTAALARHLPGHARVEAVPETLQRDVVLVEVLDRTTLQPPDPALLRAHSPGTAPDDLRAVTAASHAVALVVLTMGEAPALSAAVAAADRAVADVAAATGGLALDDDTLQLLSPAHLRARAEDGVLGHSTVRVAQDGDALRAVTLGMARFGCPELVIERFQPAETQGVHALLELARQVVTEAPGLPASDTLVLPIAQLQDVSQRGAQVEMMVPGATGQASVGLRWVQGREDDPENALLELIPEPDLTQLLLSLYGTTTPGPDLLASAREAARRELFGPVRERFAGGLPPDARLLVKGPFTDADGGQEWMWVGVARWENGQLTGVLTNTPNNIPGLHEGSTVVVQEDEVFDYLYVHADGRTEGNRTAALLELGG